MAESSEAYVVKTKDGSYVLKKIHNTSNDQLRLQKDISDFIGVDLISRVLYYGVRGDYAIQVLNYFDGEHKYGIIKDKEGLISSVYNLLERMKNFFGRIDKNLEEVIRSLVNSTEDPNLKEYGNMLLSNNRFMHLIKEDKQVLVHYDLHRSNIIFTNEGIRFIDLGDFMLAPEQFQPASFFMASLLLEELENFSLENTLLYWPGKNIFKEDIILLMKVRAFMGCAFFQGIKDKSINERELYEKYLKSIFILQCL